MRLTQERANAAALPENRSESIIFDEQVPGFGLRLRRGGSRSWIVQYKLGSRSRRMTLGSISVLNAEKARKAAQEILAKVRLGHDPQGERIQNRTTASDTFEVIASGFLQRQAKRLKARSLADTQRYLLVLGRPMHGFSLAQISRRQIAEVLRRIAEENGAVSADRARAAYSAMFNWAIREGYCETNPVLATNRAAPAIARDRVLSDAELERIWKALPAGDYGSIVKLLVLTGARREEIGGLHVSEIDFAQSRIVLPANRTKNSRPHEIPLSPLAHEIVEMAASRSDREYLFGRGSAGFNGYSKAKKELDIALGEIEPWRLHDIRRTAATRMAEIGVQPHIVEAVLNHVSGYKAGVAGVYNRAAYSQEKREALCKWAELVAGLLRSKYNHH